MGKIMWWKHWSNFKDNVKYIHNDVAKPFRVSILQYNELANEMNELAKYFTPHHPPSKKYDMYGQAKWRVRDCNFTVYDIRVTTKDGLPTFMQDETEEKY